MDRRQFSEREATLEVRACAYAVKAALRKGGVFLRRDATVGLVLPRDARAQPYKDAVRSVLKTSNLAAIYTAILIEEDRKAEHFWARAAETLEGKAAVVLLIPEDAIVPPHIEIAMDRIVHVGEIRPAHLAAALWSTQATRISNEEAAALLDHPPDLLFAALRKGRSVATVLRRLETLRNDKPKREVSELGVEDLPGFGDAKEWALNLAIDLRDWRAGSIRWSDVDRGLLISGPPGTGKTMFAAAVAQTCGARFIETSAAQWQAAGHLGNYLKAMHKTFREASENAPTILFIDEFDAVGDRSQFSGDNASYGVQVVNGLLEVLDGSSGREGVVVIAATNNPDRIDAALRRPGRLDRHVAVGLPDYHDRKSIISLHLGADLPDEAIAAAAKATTGYSGADLALLARDARTMARRGGRKVEAQDLLAVSPPVVGIDPEARWAAAIHEAGHIIVGLEYKYGTVVSIVLPREFPVRGDSLGHVQWRRIPERLRSEASYRDEIAMLMAGRAAETVCLAKTYNLAGGGRGSDLDRATDLATFMIGCLGMGTLAYHDAVRPSDLVELRMSDPEIRRLVETVLRSELKRSISIIERNRSRLEMVARAMLPVEVLEGNEINRILAEERPASA
ncbi:ATP-dependent zinc metalloprotease FtsH [Agrobacterium rubi TR3 = NBRC 13261]|uniref:ATP-dependent zinc metalloprotease FtsH n=1 Tax=Agrobacterium rubi TR3 = NBRC 13261 TaxID=1368415 RepID=A0A081D3D2_9HYPH|nr:AAA family ATPase [Agrobacterium rubi]MBP1881617.1 AAA+ superfamily predicted ATPase [Agrobacterium rubi]GAK73428.1 ATP-dependent zinc metalloprotease FtsH [Agrobacterium rubi TR3 = NBRC 13261]